MAKDALLIDGLCSLCTRTGKFISRRQVAELEIIEQDSDKGVELLKRYNLKIDSLVLIRNKKAYVRSSAAIRCLLYMRWNWRCLYPLAWIVPMPIRDLVYVLVAKSRHRI
jgi:predicted DCC family thiol-disulfide oxidoreductase YuxK